jgi:hypothetical protein
VTYVALTLVLALVVETIAWSGYMLKIEHRHQRERDRLIDQILHLSGRTWTPPPARLEPSVEPEYSYSVSPEQDVGV